MAPMIKPREPPRPQAELLPAADDIPAMRARAKALRADIDALIDKHLEISVGQHPGVPAQVLRSLLIKGRTCQCAILDNMPE